MRDSSRPLVTMHYAQTLDGRIATRSGQSRWISCDATLRMAHRLRAEHHAVMVGVGTVVADNPRLTVRLAEGQSPLRIVTDSTLRLPLGSHVLTDGAAPTLLATTTRAPEERRRAVARQGVEIMVVDEDANGLVDARDLMVRLAARGIGSVLIEGGSRLITTVLRQRLADRLIVCIAPKIIGAGIEAVGNLNILHMDDALPFDGASFSVIGEDIIFDGHLAGEPVRHA